MLKTICNLCGFTGKQGGNLSNGWTVGILTPDEHAENGSKKRKAISICPKCTAKTNAAYVKPKRKVLEFRNLEAD